MDIFFRFIKFLQGLFIKNSDVIYLSGSESKQSKLKNFVVETLTSVNQFNNTIVTRDYLIHNLTPQKCIQSFYVSTGKRAIRKICRDVVDIIYIHSEVKIDRKKLYKIISTQYNGTIQINGITITFIQK